MVRRTTEKVIFPELSYQIAGLLFEIHNQLGRFAREVQYAAAFEQLLQHHGIPYTREAVVPTGDVPVRTTNNRIDFFIGGKIVVELKAKPTLERLDYEQLHRYLQAIDASLGILVNFHERFLRPRRIIKSTIRDISVHS